MVRVVPLMAVLLLFALAVPTTVQGRSRSEVCYLPNVQGSCKALMIRYFFNKATGKCEQYKYGGCGANANHFHTLEECRRVCG